VKHWPGCNVVPDTNTECVQVNIAGEPKDPDNPFSDQTCAYELPAFTTYDVSQLDANEITTALNDKDGGTENYVSA